jgi:PIN domain
MLHLLVDTCVWLDLAKDYREQPVISALEDLISARQIKLVVPQVVLEEFDRNKARVIEDARRSLQSHFRLVREAVNRFGDDEYRAKTLNALNEVDHKIVTGNESALDSVEKIEKLLKAQPTIATADAIKRRVTERALAGLAPYHRAKNSVGDAILIEVYAELVGGRQSKRKRFALVTHNSKDFSEPNGDRRKPHPDLASLFAPPKSTYWGSLVDLIKDVDSELLADHDSEFNFSHQPRRLSEILEAEHLLFRQVWYNRHWNLRTEIEQGKHQVVPEAEYSRDPYLPHQTVETVWAQALAAAKKTEDEVGLENLGPWDDFEWGMLNGKLSALRWILGDDWDMLDT